MLKYRCSALERPLSLDAIVQGELTKWPTVSVKEAGLLTNQIEDAILNIPKSSFGSRFISFNIFAKRVGSSYRKYSTDLISLFSEFAENAFNSLADYPKIMMARK